MKPCRYCRNPSPAALVHSLDDGRGDHAYAPEREDGEIVKHVVKVTPGAFGGEIVSCSCNAIGMVTGDVSSVRRRVNSHLEMCGQPAVKWPLSEFEKLGRVRTLLQEGRRVSPSDRMTVYLGDLEWALGEREERVESKLGIDG
jgi:hypothetical protein